MKNKSNDTQVLKTISRQKILETFKSLGFSVDTEGPSISILRNNKFPFQRISLPKDEEITVYLLKEYSRILGISPQIFLED